MKKKLLILFGVLMFFQFGYSSSCFRPRYLKDKNMKVFYQSTPDIKEIVQVSDYETFEIIDENFGMDSTNLYYKGKIMKNFDVGTFEVVVIERIQPDPVQKSGCLDFSRVETFRDKNGEYYLDDIYRKFKGESILD